jgi:hypothetical protein
VHRDAGPGALVRLIGNALRLDANTFRNALGPDSLTRLHLAVVIVAAISAAFGAATQATSEGLLQEREIGLYRVFVIGWGVGMIVHFLLFVGAVWLLRAITRRPPVDFQALLRLLALSLAPACLLFIGAAIGYPEQTGTVVTLWRWLIALVGLRVATGASWLGAAGLVIVADLVASPVADLLMLGTV